MPWQFKDLTRHFKKVARISTSTTPSGSEFQISTKRLVIRPPQTYTKTLLSDISAMGKTLLLFALPIPIRILYTAMRSPPQPTPLQENQTKPICLSEVLLKSYIPGNVLENYLCIISYGVLGRTPYPKWMSSSFRSLCYGASIQLPTPFIILIPHQSSLLQEKQTYPIQSLRVTETFHPKQHLSGSTLHNFLCNCILYGHQHIDKPVFPLYKVLPWPPCSYTRYPSYLRHSSPTFLTVLPPSGLLGIVHFKAHMFLNSL